MANNYNQCHLTDLSCLLWWEVGKMMNSVVSISKEQSRDHCTSLACDDCSVWYMGKLIRGSNPTVLQGSWTPRSKCPVTKFAKWSAPLGADVAQTDPRSFSTPNMEEEDESDNSYSHLSKDVISVSKQIWIQIRIVVRQLPCGDHSIPLVQLWLKLKFDL